MGEKMLLVVDTECELCNRSVALIMKNDGDVQFTILSLYDPKVREILLKFGLPENHNDSIVLIDKGRVYLRSDAVLRIVKYLKGMLSILSWIRILPRFLRNAGYNYIAKHRKTLKCKIL
jgi:predicted DCC family thiol-disulfide oxidoreductase YuxK